jgi:hypothetical protein
MAAEPANVAELIASAVDTYRGQKRELNEAANKSFEAEIHKVRVLVGKADAAIGEAGVYFWALALDGLENRPSFKVS